MEWDSWFWYNIKQKNSECVAVQWFDKKIFEIPTSRKYVEIVSSIDEK